MTPYHHAKSSAKKFGGKPEDYFPLHQWFDASKAHVGGFVHRAYRHHAEGTVEAERLFGPVITNHEGREIPTRLIGERHVVEDLGRLPTMADWFRRIRPLPWMMTASKKFFPSQHKNRISPPQRENLRRLWAEDVQQGVTELGFEDYIQGITQNLRPREIILK